MPSPPAQIQPQPGWYRNPNVNIINQMIAKLNASPPSFGNTWFVNGSFGSDQNGGTSPAGAFRTMAKAFTKIGSGDTIYFMGNIREQLETPVGIFSVSIIGLSTSPRNADAQNGNAGYYAATWKSPASPTALTPLLKVNQQGWLFSNFLVNPPADAAGIQLFRNAGAGDAERDASHAQFFNMRFDGGAGGLYGIQNNGGCGFVTVDGCKFYRLTEAGGAGIVCTSTAVAVPLNWIIQNNHFANNYYSIFSSMSYSVVKNNVMGRFTSGGVAMNVAANAAQGEYNYITGNALSGTYSNAVMPAGTNNEWAGNISVSITATNAGAITTADPA